jgi:low affinity Fe/Cu permease
VTDIDPQATDTSAAAGPPPRSFDRFLPVTAIAVMVGTFVTMNPFVAMSLIAAVWLIGTRINRSRRLLGFSLTEALAWAATIAIVEFLAIVVLYLLSSLAAT